jgi:Fe-S cluster biogenesis protein NfuA
MYKVIDIEPTPNPDAQKFIVNERLLDQGSRSFETAAAAEADPLARALFNLKGVQSVFYMERFVSVSKNEQTRWKDLEPQVRQEIEKAAPPASAAGHEKPISKEDSEMLGRINTVIDANIRPALAGDGGGLEVLDFDNLTLTIHYQGACGSCPSATQGTIFDIQNLLQRMVDPRIRVVMG